VITYELTQFYELRQKFDPKMVDKALGQALQVATRKLRTRISKEARLVYNIKARDLAKSSTIRRYSGGYMLIYAGRKIGLDKFSARPRQVNTARGKRLGVTVEVLKRSGRKIVKGGFMPNGKYIAKRVGEEDYPFERLFGPSVPDMAGNEVVGNIALVQVKEDATMEFDRFLSYLMEKA